MSYYYNYYYYYSATPYYDNYVTRYYGDQNITVDCGRDKVTTGYGNDTIHVGDGAYNYVDAGEGNNTVTSGSGNDTVYTGCGHDVISTGDGCDTIKSTGGDNQIDAGAGSDKIYTGYGDDHIKAGSGNDYVNAGHGDNVVDAGAGCDTVITGCGEDTIDGGSGHDVIKSGAGNDVVNGGSGSDKVYAQNGHDKGIYNFAENKDSCDYYDGGCGCDTLVIELTQAEFNRKDVQHDLACYQQHIHCGWSEWPFYFSSRNLTVVSWEKLEIVITDATQLEAVNDVANTSESTAVTVDVIANDKSSDTLTLTNASISNGAEGSVDIVNNQIVYTPTGFESLTQGQTATVDISYEVTTQTGEKATAILTVTVEGQNDAPVANADSITIEISKDTNSNVKPLLVLANDSDADGAQSELQLQSFEVTDGNSADFSMVNNDLVFNANAYNDLAYGQTKTFTYSYIVADALGATSTATGSVTVKGNNDLINADNGVSYRTDEDTSINMNVLEGVSSLDSSQTLSVENATVNSDVVTVTVVDNQIVLQPIALDLLQDLGTNPVNTGVNQTSVDVTYDVVSTSGQRQTITKTVVIDGVNDAPVIMNNPFEPVTVGEGTQPMQFTLVNNAELNSDGVQLTAAVKNQRGAVWTKEQVDISESFSLSATLNFGNKGYFGNADIGADGIALVFQSASNQAEGNNAGGDIGYYGLKNSFTVEMDTYQNAKFEDPAADHVGFGLNGEANTVETKTLSFDLEDGKDHTLRFDWDSDKQTASVYIDGQFVTVYQGDITDVIGSNDAYIGFTSATGTSSNVHTVKDMSFTPASKSESVTFDIKATDVDQGDVLTLSANLVDSSLGSLIALDSDTLQFTPNQPLAEGQTLNVGFEYTVTDSYGGEATASSTIQMIGAGSGFTLDPVDSSQFII